MDVIKLDRMMTAFRKSFLSCRFFMCVESEDFDMQHHPQTEGSLPSVQKMVRSIQCHAVRSTNTLR